MKAELLIGCVILDPSIAARMADELVMLLTATTCLETSLGIYTAQHRDELYILHASCIQLHQRHTTVAVSFAHLSIVSGPAVGGRNC